MPKTVYPETPDGRYFVVDARLWRLSDPKLKPADRTQLVSELMKARRAIRTARGNGDLDAERSARERVDLFKRALGERGPVWWTDGAPDYNRELVEDTPYAAWFASIGLVSNSN